MKGLYPLHAQNCHGDAVSNARPNRPESGQSMPTPWSSVPFSVSYTWSKLRTHFLAEAEDCQGHAFPRYLGSFQNLGRRKRSHVLTITHLFDHLKSELLLALFGWVTRLRWQRALFPCLQASLLMTRWLWLSEGVRSQGICAICALKERAGTSSASFSSGRTGADGGHSPAMAKQ